jgi:hypothetical protein
MMKAVIAFLCSAAALPELLINRRFLPNPPSPESVAWADDKSWYHNFKNYTAESFAADSGYYSKLTCFVILVQFIIIIWQWKRIWHTN